MTDAQLRKHNAAIRDRLLSAGAKHIREFGYAWCEEEHLFSDYIASRMFLSQLEQTLKDVPERHRDARQVVASLIEEVKEKMPKELK